MRIDFIHFKRFKSLYDVEISPGKFVTVTGPNGSGKSNFATAIAFLGETYRFGLEYAVGRAGGIDSIAYRRAKRTTVPVSFTIKVELDSRDSYITMSDRLVSLRGNIQVEHNFDVKAGRRIGDSTFTVSQEKISITYKVDMEELLVFEVRSSQSAGGRAVNFDFGDDDRIVGLRDYVFERFSQRSDFRRLVSETTPSTELMISSVPFIPILREFKNSLSRLNVFRLNAGACRRPGILTPNATLSSDGSNLPGVVARLRRPVRRHGGRSPAVDSAYWGQIVESMSEIFPNLVDIDTSINPSSGELDLQFHEQDVGRPWSAREVSDGTIQYLALLAAMDARTSPMIVVEEPENALHSWMLRIFIDKCRNDTSSQILLTTHSPVAMKSVHPEEVLLAWKSAGRTYLKPLTVVDPGASELFHVEGIDVFEQYDSGFLAQTLPSWGNVE
ncbi:AAA family ATPase [Amycolatopsis lurida]